MTIRPVSKRLIVATVPASVYRSRLSEASQYVTDETDTPFVALALAKSPSVIITRNKRHFRVKLLLRRGVRVLTPIETVRLAAWL